MPLQQVLSGENYKVTRFYPCPQSSRENVIGDYFLARSLFLEEKRADTTLCAHAGVGIKGGSRGRVQGVRTTPRDDLGLSNTTVDTTGSGAGDHCILSVTICHSTFPYKHKKGFSILLHLRGTPFESSVEQVQRCHEIDQSIAIYRGRSLVL